MQDPGWIYRYVFESGAPTMVLDAQDLQVLAANPQMAELTGIALESLVGRPPSFMAQADPLSGPDWRRYQSARIHRRDGSEVTVEVTVLCVEQVPKPAVVLRVDPVEPGQGMATSKLESKHAALQRAHRELQAVYNRNELLIDKLHHRNQELQQVYRRLSYASKMAAIGELTAGTTHGINNPLAAAVSANREITRLLERIDDPELNDTLQSLCSRTDRALKRIEGIVSDLRRLAQAGSGRQDVKQVFLDQEIQLALDLLGHRLKNVELELDVPDQVPIRVAPDEFNQVIMNLIDNAVYAMEGSGRIQIRAKAEQEALVIEIQDDGPGIPSDIIERVFDPFFSTKTPGQGSGIGLSVARGIIEGYAGTISVNATPGAGTRFTICLPIEDSHENETPDLGR